MKAQSRKSPRPHDLRPQVAEIERDLSAIRRAMRRPLEAAYARGGLTVPQKAVMHVVVTHDGISLRDLARQVSLAHSTVSGIVDRLEKRGFVQRHPDPADGRISRIHPSAEVAAFMRGQMPALLTGPLETALRQTNATERERIAKALRRLRELLESD